MVDQIEVENEQGVVKQDIFMEKKMLKGVNRSDYSKLLPGQFVRIV